MSFLLGQQENITSMPGDIGGLRQGLISYLQNQGYETAVSGMPKSGDLSPFMDLFKSGLAPVLAQAKESAGSLTGSGLGSTIGATAGRATSGFLLDLLNQRANRFSSLLSGISNTGVSAQPGYKPGFLDYLFKGASAAAPLLAGPAGFAATAGAKVNYGYGGDTSTFGSGFGPNTPGQVW